ncbi:hypothetical protein [Tropicibacter alexandrii]|uniref:hypothetical protein n=1 Tax=Tropicibacter alexandrii TaxID=2267683 RepID=UPI0010087A0A|nr:hypothetical protein [Tropicibacter alexandrii]
MIDVGHHGHPFRNGPLQVETLQNGPPSAARDLFGAPLRRCAIRQAALMKRETYRDLAQNWHFLV